MRSLWCSVVVGGVSPQRRQWCSIWACWHGLRGSDTWWMPDDGGSEDEDVPTAAACLVCAGLVVAMIMYFVVFATYRRKE